MVSKATTAKQLLDHLKVTQAANIPLSNLETIPIVVRGKVSKYPVGAKVTMHNESIWDMTEEQLDEIIAQLDFDQYIKAVSDAANNWHNVLKPS